MIPLISFTGRVARKPFWLYSLGAAGLVTLLFVLLSVMGFGVAVVSTESATLLFLWGVWGVLSIPVYLCLLSLSVRRWHDLGKSGWWVLINLLPVFGNLYAIVMTGLVEGTRGPNAYGEGPKLRIRA